MTRLPSAAWLLSPRQGPVLILTSVVIVAGAWCSALGACESSMHRWQRSPTRLTTGTRRRAARRTSKLCGCRACLETSAVPSATAREAAPATCQRATRLLLSAPCAPPRGTSTALSCASQTPTAVAMLHSCMFMIAHLWLHHTFVWGRPRDQAGVQ